MGRLVTVWGVWDPQRRRFVTHGELTRNRESVSTSALVFAVARKREAAGALAELKRYVRGAARWRLEPIGRLHQPADRQGRMRRARTKSPSLRLVTEDAE